jgi:hypothetical protein
MHANMAHGNLTVVYELDILQSPLSLDECCPLDWMTISLRVHNTVQLLTSRLATKLAL